MRRTVIALGLVVVLVVGAVVGDYYYLGSLVHRTAVDNLQSVGSNGQPSENILLIGSTDRCALKVQNKAYGLCQDGVNGINSDIDMVLHLDPTTHYVSLLSIPRDLFIPNARNDGANKIDAGLYDGPSQLVASIEEDFGIPINHYVELNFDTFADVVNALGGVRMYFPVPVYDAESGLNIERSGCYLLDGYRALQLVRARHLQIQPDPSNHDPHTWPQEALSDLARITRTHEFLRVLAAKVASHGLDNLSFDQSIAEKVLPDLTVDSGFSESAMVSLARSFAHTDIAEVKQYTYPVITVQSGSLLYQGYYYGDVEFPLQPTGTSTIDSIFDVGSGDDTFTGAALPAASSVKVSVENGTGVANQAAVIANGLAAKGFVVTSTGNVTPDGPVSESVVWYGGPPPPKNGNWTSPEQADAEAVMAHLQGPVILGYDPSMVTPGATVTVQTGTDVSLRPSLATGVVTASSSAKKGASKASSSAKGASKASATSTTTTTVYDPPGVDTNNDFSAPSSINAPLEPWDPRPCNAAGTGPANDALAATTSSTAGG